MHQALLPLLVVLAVPALAAAERPKLAVISTQVEQSAKGQLPKLFDDYLLTAVHELGTFEVVGQDDINALIGFEKQKQLLGCDDVTCMADIGGALGVELLLGAKVARLANDWAITIKVINIKSVKVESRSSDFVKGDAKALLEAVPGIVHKLFGLPSPTPAAAAEVTPAAVPTHTPSAAPVAPAVTAKRLDPTLGSGQRRSGSILFGVGMTAVGTGALIALLKSSRLGDPGKELWRSGGYVGAVVGGRCYEFTTSTWDSNRRTQADGTPDDTAGDCDVANLPMLALAAAIYGSGLLASGVGAQRYIDGKAVAATGDLEATASYPYMWLGYLLAGVGVAAPILGGVLKSDLLGYGGGLTGVLGSSLLFAMSLSSDAVAYSPSASAELPVATFNVVERGGRWSPVVGLSGRF